ncbi:hypothetical protein H5410_046824, partial [Solanum commersonii]
MDTIDIVFTLVKDEESSIPTSNCLENGNLQIFKAKENCLQTLSSKLIVKKCVAKDHSAQLVGIADPLGDPPFGLYLYLWVMKYLIAELFGDSPIAHLSHRLDFLLQNLAHATQNSIMNAHKKSQLIRAKINCALKDSSCDSPLPKNLKLNILPLYASSSPTKVCPYFPTNICFSSLKIKKVFLRLVTGLSAK